jgi:hypothetical protein
MPRLADQKLALLWRGLLRSEFGFAEFLQKVNLIVKNQKNSSKFIKQEVYSDCKTSLKSLPGSSRRYAFRHVLKLLTTFLRISALPKQVEQ